MEGSKTLKVGFIGLGLMGRPMANQLLKKGYDLFVWNRTKEKADKLIDKGAIWVDTPTEVARNTEIVITMVTDSKAVDSVVCGREGILKGADKSLRLIDMSSIKPEASRKIADKAREEGIIMLDAPVTGNPDVAARGELGIMIGGPEEVYQQCLPLFEAMGVKIVYVGPENGAGTTLKLINNLILGVSIMAAAEALVLAKKSGINPERVIEITSVGGARTGAMETRGPRMVKGEFSPHFSANNMYKDLSSALELADELMTVLPAANISREFLKSVLAKGLGEKDSCIVIKVLEDIAAINN